MYQLPLLGKQTGSFISVLSGSDLCTLKIGNVVLKNPLSLRNGYLLNIPYVEAGTYTIQHLTDDNLVISEVVVTVPTTQVVCQSEPLALLWSYQPGSFSNTKPLTDGTNDLSVPIVFNALGQLPTSVFRNGEYTLLLTDKDGVVLQVAE